MPALVRSFAGKSPRIGSGVFLADTAVLTGDIELADDVNIWFGSVLRGDVGWIRIGARTNIQDLSMLHMSHALSNTEIGEDVTVGHGVIIHGAIIGSGALIGMGSILLDNAEIGEQALVAAGTLVTKGTKVPPRHLIRGNPGKIVRELEPEEWQSGKELAARYVELARAYQP